MSNLDISIANEIQNNRYFVDARHWYMMKYVFPVIERFYAFLLAAVFVSAGIAELIFVNNLYVENIRFVVPIHLDDTIKYQPVIKVLNSSILNDMDPYNATSEYLVSNYVKTRESYDYNSLEGQLTKIENNSTKHIYKEFYDSMSLGNAKSPVLLYQSYAKRTIKIKSATMSGDNSYDVSFDAVVVDGRHNVLESSSWVASVSFSMSDINYILQKNSDKFYFFVNGYQVTPAQQVNNLKN